MNITFLLTQDLESSSGLGRYFPLAKELTKIGYQANILALHPNLSGLSQRRIKKDGVEVHYVGQMHVRKVRGQKTYFNNVTLLRVALASTLRMAGNSFRISADVFHLGKAQPINGAAGLLGAKLLRRRPLYLDCDDYEADSNRFFGAWQKAVVALWEDHLPHFVAGITVNTRFLQERNIALGYPEERIVYVPNGVDRERFANLDPTAPRYLKSRLGLEGKKVVLYVGSMSLTTHPVGLLLEAFVLVSRECPEAVLVLVGTGEDYERVCQRAEALGLREKALFTGRVSPEAIPYYLQMADVTVDPVNDDPTARARSPLKVFESMAVGTPVVTGDVGDRRNILGDGEAGMLVNPGDAHALAKGIVTVLRDRDRAQAMREAGLRLRERYYWDVLVHDFVRIYDGAV